NAGCIFSKRERLGDCAKSEGEIINLGSMGASETLFFRFIKRLLYR
ncbi:MAG: hypothetical protein ACI90Q_000548, partial [Nonlabens sp.]